MFDLMLLATSILMIFVLLTRLRRVDIERRRIAAELNKVTRAQDSMSAVGLLTGEMSHLVNSPLTVILGQCELARGHDENLHRIGIIQRQARRIADVVERFGSVGKEHRNEMQEVDPARCALAVLDSLETLASERDVRIHEVIEPCPSIRANPALLGHALRHLLRTAIQAAPRGVGDVTLAVGVMPADNGPDHVIFAVADDGPGIPPEQLPRVFHPFPEDGANVRGEGFSYAVVYAIARSMGATVVVDSAPGAGTRATLKVPLEIPNPMTGSVISSPRSAISEER